ncbi:hypothetical protein C0Q70_18763 [Pomacea canaliculata]|uniref:Uncharacterized protein n=1 Tax=Pomacea canaliculata TaxID=400727 RepID=A0A2T7NHF1_POMCA|nr:hypothetical protein C0Q70_18763 [Pomacea canaliculata]
MQRTLLACDSLTRSQHVCAAQHRPSAAAAAAVVPASFHPLTLLPDRRVAGPLPPTSCAPCCVVDRRSVQFHPYFCCSEAGVSPLTHLASERVRTEFVHIPLVTALHRQGARAARDAVRGKGEDGEEGDRVPGWRQTRARHKTQMGAGQDSMLAPGFLSKEKHC